MKKLIGVTKVKDLSSKYQLAIGMVASHCPFLHACWVLDMRPHREHSQKQGCIPIQATNSSLRKSEVRQLFSLFLYNNLFILFLYIFGCVRSLLLHVGFLWLPWAGIFLRCSVRASHCSVFSCWGAWALGTWASVVVARGLSSCGSQTLDCRLSSCGTRA